MGRKKKSLQESIETVQTAGGEAISNGGSAKARTKSFTLDLRIHSPASLGYLGIEGIDTAPALVRLAKTKGLDVIAVTDFYTGSYLDRIIEAAKGTPLVVIPGVDLRVSVGGCNDVVLSCLFPEHYDTAGISEFLKELDVPTAVAGDQNYVVKRAFEDILTAVESRGGIALPSRIDKTPHRTSAIPILVEVYGFRTFDLAYTESSKFFKSRWPKTKFQLFSFSNANALAQVGTRTARAKLDAPNFEGIRSLVGRVPVATGFPLVPVTKGRETEIITAD